MDMMSIRRRMMMQNTNNVPQNMLNGIESGVYNAYGSDSSSSTRLRSIGSVNVVGEKQYKIDASTTLTKTVQAIVTFFTEIGKINISQTSWTNVPFTFTTPSNANLIRCMIRYSDNSNISASDVTAEIVEV